MFLSATGHLGGALADLDDFRAFSLAYRAAGRRIEVIVLATAEALSQLGIVDRFLKDRRLAVQGDTERAAAWSEPVRRTAQPTTAPPGVAYHRLWADEHRWIFDELITPTVLAGVTPRDDPRAVYVLGRPGAGKLLAARMVRRAMRTGTTRLVGDDFKASHPDYFQLLRDDPRSAGAAIRCGAAALMGTDLRPGVLAVLLNLLGVLHAELTGGLDSTLLPLGFRELASGELFQQLGDGGAALVGEDTQPVAHFLAGLDARRLAHAGGSTAGRTTGAVPSRRRQCPASMIHQSTYAIATCLPRSSKPSVSW
ncbi:zeta toxin family protein [Streptomyces mirabilis]|uniref:zeta toxin family protein n=1 Tax=Streptomyces mirabilis TaxID=68239 RepID=UPI0036B276E1